jgi:hypothetical protein
VREGNAKCEMRNSHFTFYISRFEISHFAFRISHFPFPKFL